MPAGQPHAVSSPPSPAPGTATDAVTVEKLDGMAEAERAFQDATVTQEELARLTVGPCHAVSALLLLLAKCGPQPSCTDQPGEAWP